MVSLHVRLTGPALPGYLRRALGAKKRAEALGGTLAAWGADTFAFDFATEEMEEAIDLAVATFDDLTLGIEPRFSAGVAHGPLTRLGMSGSLAMLAWGEALVVASSLARAAHPGEVLVDAACPHHVRHALRTVDERHVEDPPCTALVLDTHQPLRRDTLVDALHAESGALVVVTVPPLPPLLGLARDLFERPPLPRERRGSEPPPTVRGDVPGGMTEGEETPVSAAPVSMDAAPVSMDAAPEPPGAVTDAPVSAAPVSAGPVSAAPVSAAPVSSSDAVPEPISSGARLVTAAPESGDVPSSGDRREAVAPPPPSVVAPASSGVVAPPSSGVVAPPSSGGVPPPRLPPARMAPSVPPPSLGASRDLSSVPPLAASRISWPGGSEEYVELAAAARQALLKGNVTELERLSDELKTHGEHGDLAERMAGFVAWNRGAKAEGLRKLRAAADAEVRPAHRVRALLAYGVALAASGRTDAALLAALGAIARAREVADRQGEHVCARFLARLSAAAGYERAARTWGAIADELSGSPQRA